MTFVELLERAILDATDLEWMYRLDAPPPSPRVYCGLDPKDLITSRVPVGVLSEPTGLPDRQRPEQRHPGAQ